MAADGTVVKALDDDEVRALAGRLRELGIDSVAVCFLHSYLYPEHEQRVGAILAEELPEATISLSSEILREQREYERSATTVVNAYVRPLMSSYIDRIRTGLDGIGLRGRAARDHAVVRRRDDLRRREAAARLRARVGACGGRRRRARHGEAARDRERDRLRHGRHDRQGVADRERLDLPRARVRGRRLDLGRQPADPRRGRAPADPDDRHRRGRRRRRQHRLARSGGRPPGRPEERRRRARPGLLRARRRRADGHRRERRARLHAGGTGRRRPDHDPARARRGGRGSAWPSRSGSRCSRRPTASTASRTRA